MHHNKKKNELTNYLLILYNECFFQGWSQQFHHLSIRKVVAYMFQYIFVSYKPQCSEDDYYWNISPDIWKSSSNVLT